MSHTCDGCQYRDHSGAFTSGGSRLTCRHPLAKGEQDLPGDTPLSMFLRHGFTEEDAKLNLKGSFGSYKDLKEMPSEHHWIRRVRPSDGTAPSWCPEVPPRVLKEHIRILRKALERVNRECDATPHEDPHLCYTYDSVTAETVVAVRAALEATKGSE